MITPSPSRARSFNAGAALFLAAGVLVSSVASSAAATWPQNQGFTNEEVSENAPHARAAFERHFWRGTPMTPAPTQDVETVALDADAEATEAYCMDRFKSYDPSTGTYLGYDGNEHACP